MNKLTKQLFPNFPREIAFPWRKTVYSLLEFKREVQNNQGINDIYTSIYGSNFLINKLFFDLDYGDDVLGDAKKIVNFCNEQGYQSIPIVSGKKGYHIYIIVKPQIHKEKSKINLLTAHYSILNSVFGEFKRQMHTLKSGKTVSILRTKDRIIGPDPQICGDVRRIARVPNTLRPPENINYCTYLPPDEFLDMSNDDVMIHKKSPHSYKTRIDYRNAPNLTDFKYEFDEMPNFDKWTPIESNKELVVFGNPSSYLKGLLRPCLYRHMITIHPADTIRFASTLDLLTYTDLTPKEITSLYSVLGWEDFDREKTYNKIKNIQQNVLSGRYKPWPCQKLVSMNIPRICCVE